MVKEVIMKKLVEAMKKLAVQTGSLACLGCYHEHSCSVHGCAIIRTAVEELERTRWIPVTEQLPATEDEVLVIVSGKPMGNIELIEAYELASYDPVQGQWFLDSYPEWTSVRPTFWMPLPEHPEEDPHG